jgi:DNA-binding beta-propeller fold protein YncE
MIGSRGRWGWGRVLVVGVTVLVVSSLFPLQARAATQTFTGTVDASGTKWRAHRFDVTSVGTIDATLDWNNASANLNLFLYDPSGTLVAQAVSKTAKPETITYDATVTGTWKLGVKAVSGASGYTLVVDLSSSGGVRVPTYVRTIGGGTAGHAEMYPSGVDVDPSGNVYVADTGDDQVQSYDASGALRWTVGSRGSKTLGRFYNPRDVAFLNGKVYVADTGYNRVQVLNASNGSAISAWPTRFGTIMGIGAGVDGVGNDVILVTESSADAVRVYRPDGTFVRTVGSGPGSGLGQLNEPRDAATDAAGKIYVADYLNSRVETFAPNGSPLGGWGVKGTGPGQLMRPYGIDLDDAGNVYVADSNNFVHEFTAGGTFLRVYGSPGTGPGSFSMLRRVAVAPGADPKVYGADLWTYKVEVFAQTGAYLAMLGGAPPADGFFNEPYGLAVDGTYTFVSDMVNQRVQRFGSTSPYGYQLKWGERGWGEGNPGFNWARDVTIGSKGGAQTVWVADTKNNRVTEFWPDGVPTGRVFGSGGTAVGQLRWPFAVASYGADVIVADNRNDRIQRWDPSGPSVVWSSTGPSGTPFSAPKDVFVRGDEVYVADTLNKRIVVLSAVNGSVLRTFGSGVLRGPEGVAVEPDGDVWVSDTPVSKLVEFSSSGGYLQTFGSVGGGEGQFNQPAHLEILAGGSGDPVLLFVADWWNDRIQVFDVT